MLPPPLVLLPFHNATQLNAFCTSIHTYSTYYIAHIHYLALSFIAPSPTLEAQLLFPLPELMPADEG